MLRWRATGGRWSGHLRVPAPLHPCGRLGAETWPKKDRNHSEFTKKRTEKKRLYNRHNISSNYIIFVFYVSSWYRSSDHSLHWKKWRLLRPIEPICWRFIEPICSLCPEENGVEDGLPRYGSFPSMWSVKLCCSTSGFTSTLLLI